ncbi:hypothetical protein B0H19DRAFT_1104109 [Mycena capillaripes]|nr:hypothetical protein B0H19DRAFT_1104109 [Mycena capillaripes]
MIILPSTGGPPTLKFYGNLTNAPNCATARPMPFCAGRPHPLPKPTKTSPDSHGGRELTVKR